MPPCAPISWVLLHTPLQSYLFIDSSSWPSPLFTGSSNFPHPLAALHLFTVSSLCLPFTKCSCFPLPCTYWPNIPVWSNSSAILVGSNETGGWALFQQNPPVFCHLLTQPVLRVARSTSILTVPASTGGERELSCLGTTSSFSGGVERVQQLESLWLPQVMRSERQSNPGK